MLNQLNQYILQGKNPFRINTIQNQIENQDIENSMDRRCRSTYDHLKVWYRRL